MAQLLSYSICYYGFILLKRAFCQYETSTRLKQCLLIAAAN